MIDPLLLLHFCFLTDKPVHQRRLRPRAAAPPAGRTRSLALTLSQVGSGTRKLPSSAALAQLQPLVKPPTMHLSSSSSAL